MKPSHFLCPLASFFLLFALCGQGPAQPTHSPYQLKLLLQKKIRERGELERRHQSTVNKMNRILNDLPVDPVDETTRRYYSSKLAQIEHGIADLDSEAEVRGAISEYGSKYAKYRDKTERSRLGFRAKSNYYALLNEQAKSLQLQMAAMDKEIQALQAELQEMTDSDAAPQPRGAVSARDFYTESISRSAEADAGYRGKTVELYGKSRMADAAVSQESGTVYLALETEDNGTGNVVCHFGAGHGYILQSSPLMQQVVIRAVYEGRKGRKIILKDSTIR